MNSVSNEAAAFLDALPDILSVVGYILAGWLIRPWWAATVAAGVWAIVTLIFTLLVLATGSYGVVGFDPLVIIIRVVIAVAICTVVYLIAQWSRRRVRG